MCVTPGGLIHFPSTNLSGSILSERVYFNGLHVAVAHPPSGPVNYAFQDHLGGEHIITDATGNVCQDIDTLPFGSEIGFNTACNSSYRFAGMERDNEISSNVDYAIGRYYDNRLARWLSPDPINLTTARLVNPGNTLNKYVYGANNPLKYTDSDGKDITIFYRPPSGAKGDYGHIMLGALNQATGKVGFLDYYPAGRMNGFGQGPGAFNTGNMSERAAQNAQGQFATLTIRTSPEEAQKVINLIEALKNGPTADYSALINANNCTTVCQDVLRDLGLDFGDILPSSYWSDVFYNFSADALAHPIWTRMLSARNTPGHEYGNPRNFGIGMTFSQWLFELYANQKHKPEPKACVEAHDSSGQGTGTQCE